MSCKVAPMDWGEFEERAIRAIPDQPLKPKRCWVGVLRHEIDPQSQLGELDFIWMVGHSKVSLDKIYKAYETRRELTNFHIISQHGVADRSQTLNNFMEVGTDAVIFRAVSPSASRVPPLVTPRQILHEVTVSLAPISTATPTSIAPHVNDKPRHGSGINTGTPHITPHVSTPRAPITPGGGPYTTPTRQESHDAVKLSIETPSLDPHERVQKSPADQARLITPLTITQQNVYAPVQRPPTTATTEAPIAQTNNQVIKSPTLSLPHGLQSEMPLTRLDVATAARPYSPGQDPYVAPVFHNEIEEPSQPFDPDNFFNREPSPEGGHQADTKPTDHSIRDIIKREDPEVLEAGVSEALKVLEEFKQVFVQHAASSPDAQAWVESIDKLSPQAKRKRTVVGVVGNTGAGKSSVINAMLDEERLVPTNCMRACTAVVTEMSWNDSDDPFSKYRAEIEFISRTEWEKEVGTLMKEFLTENGTLSRDASDQNSDAGIAWAKFYAVYPKISRGELEKCTVSGLMGEKGLNVLGTTKMINTAQPHRFYNELQKYVDSKEKVTKKNKDNNKDKQKNAFEMEYWPLIKVVKIYTKAPALSTGAVIVDLPGVHDSNAARAAVAQGYIKQCTGLWIVAPITRAVDDKAAKTLLGDSFKTQLKYDGGFSSVTFICSKTDDISITEAIDTLDLNEQVESFYKQREELEQEIEDAKAKIQDLQESKEVYRLAQTEFENEIQTWDELKDQLEDGNKVFAPVPKVSKRKKVTSAKKSRKKRKAGDDWDFDFVVSDDEASETEDEDEDDDDDDNDDDDDDDVQAPQEPLTEEDIKEKLKTLREAKKNARREGLEIKAKIDELKPTIRQAELKIQAIKAEVSRICISGRNEYSKGAIQQDFAAGIKELDQENAAEEDEDNFDPDEEMRDYDEVAKALPVFCVSSRAYQKMCGRLQKDDAVPGFLTPEETEMPQLQAHCKKLTEAGRIQNTRSFLLSLCQQLTTFTLWASNDGTGVKMTTDDKRKQVRYVERRLGELENGLEGAVDACLNIMKKELNDQIFDKYPDLIQEAIKAAPETAQRWGVHRADGGLAWATYKAVVRRHGAYQSPSAGHRDFNSELVEPIVKKLATGWERAFQNRLPKAFASFIADSGKILHKFHEAVEIRARENGVGLAMLSTLKAQLSTYESLFKDLGQLLTESMTNLQREANRDFTPTIAHIMLTVYDICTEEHGKGSFMRMKAHMMAFVEQNRHYMFNEATLTVKRHLDSMCKDLRRLMEEKADEIFIKLKADYLRVLGGIQINTDTVVSREERAMRQEITALLKSVDARFGSIAEGVISAPVDDNVGGAAKDPATDVDDESVAFESAHESADENAFASASGDTDVRDSIMQGTDTTMTTPPPSAKKKSKLPIPVSDDVADEEL